MAEIINGNPYPLNEKEAKELAANCAGLPL